MNTSTIPSGAVVVGIDGSAPASRAVDWAARIAAQENRPLVLVHAVHLANPILWPSIVDVRAVSEEIRASASRLVADAADGVRHHYPSLEVHPVCTAEDARDLLIGMSHTAHLIVIGSRGRGRVRRLVLGSVSSAVVRHSVCPVVVLPATARTSDGFGVVVGADGAARSMPAMEFAFRAASWRAEPLRVVSCFEEAAESYGQALTAPIHSDFAVERLAVSEALAGLADDHPDVKTEIELDRGLVEDVLSDQTEQAALVVVGRREHDAVTDFLLGSVATTLLERAHCPIAVVPTDD